ncbi:MAG: hypothetical protein K0R51_763 [Cytophagaceae bacterium]|jgi:hypothetical protein|nr:hypothetical protein [Cytophagaceae bacterium]
MIETIVEPVKGPLIQALTFILLTVLAIFVFRPENTDKGWSLAGMVFIGFMAVNSVLLWLASDTWTYFFYSLGFSVLYLVCIAILLPALLKGLNIQGSAESAMVFIFIIYHPILLLVVLFSKWVYVEFL